MNSEKKPQYFITLLLHFDITVFLQNELMDSDFLQNELMYVK
jgi:hypothetical protein